MNTLICESARRCLSILFAISIVTVSAAQTYTIDNYTLVAPNDPVNVLTLDLDAGPLGSDSDTAVLSGFADATLGVSWNGASYDVTEFSMSGGSVDVSDVTFSFLFGTVSAQSSGLGGEPMTIAPPSPVSGGTFVASDHQFTVNRGTVNAAGNVFDYSAMPIVAAGSGVGTMTLTAQSITPLTEVYEIRSEIPMAFVQPFTIPGVPIFGDVDATMTGSGNLVAVGTITIDVGGDFDRDGSLSCDDIDVLGDAIRTGSSDPKFDLNADGALDNADYEFWVTDLKQTVLGDANFDGRTDTSDFNVWNNNKFVMGTGWCQGDFNGDGNTDTSDFNIWNANKFTSAPAPVPEPGGLWLLIVGGLALLRRVRD